MVHWNEWAKHHLIKRRFVTAEKADRWASASLKTTFGYWWAIALAIGLWCVILAVALSAFSIKAIWMKESKKRLEQHVEVGASIEAEPEGDEAFQNLEVEK